MPQALGVWWGVTMAAAPVSNVLGLEGCQVVESWILLQDFLQHFSDCHCSLPLKEDLIQN